MTERADLVVVGAGVAGLAAAITGARAGLDTVLLGGPVGSSRDIPETLAAPARPLLGQLGLDEILLERSFAPVALRLSRWGLGPARYVPAIVSVNETALILHKPRLRELLRARAQAVGVRVVEAGRVLAVREARAGMVLEVRGAGGSVEIDAGFVIEATGRAAAFAQRCGVRRRILDNLVSFWVEGPAAGEGARVIGTVTVRDGWLFYAGRPAGTAALGFFTAGSVVRSKPTSSDVLDRLAFAPELLALIADMDRWRDARVLARNAATTLLERFGEGHWLACGDALQTVDPMGSSGLYTALRQGMDAASAAAAALTGDERPRREYERRAAEEFRDFQARRRAYYGQATSVAAPSAVARAVELTL